MDRRYAAAATGSTVEAVVGAFTVHVMDNAPRPAGSA
jgi:hypothetical protein